MNGRISAEHMAAICLILADGNVETNMLAIIRRAEAYQRAQDDFWGVTPDDFRHAMMWLALYGGLWNWETIRRAQDADLEFGRNSLADFLPLMLKYEAVYCNDEGEGWHGVDEPPSEARFKLGAFLAGADAGDPEQVMAFLGHLGWTAEWLALSLRPDGL